MEKHPICIKKTLIFSIKLLGCPYNLFKGFQTEKDSLDISYLKENGMNSVGFINILRRFNKLKIPGTGKINSWFFYLKRKNRLKKIIKNKKYPNGTLFLANYKARGDKDPGHMAVIFSNKIIHCYNDEGVIINDLKKSDSLFGGKYYTHICFPKDWILID